MPQPDARTPCATSSGGGGSGDVITWHKIEWCAHEAGVLGAMPEHGARHELAAFTPPGLGVGAAERARTLPTPRLLVCLAERIAETALRRFGARIVSAPMPSYKTLEAEAAHAPAALTRREVHLLLASFDALVENVHAKVREIAPPGTPCRALFSAPRVTYVNKDTLCVHMLAVGADTGAGTGTGTVANAGVDGVLAPDVPLPAVSTLFDDTTRAMALELVRRGTTVDGA